MFMRSPSSLGSLSKDDGDGNENGKKAIGLDWRLPFYGHVTPLLSDPGNEIGNAKGLEISVQIQNGEPHCFGR